MNRYEFAFNFVNKLNELGNAPNFELFDNTANNDDFCIRANVVGYSMRVDIGNDVGILSIRGSEDFDDLLVRIAESVGFKHSSARRLSLESDSDLILARRFDTMVKIISALA